MAFSPRSSRLAGAAALGLLLLTTCSDDTTGPRAGLAGQLSLVPDFGILQTGIVPIARGRFVLTRIPSGTVAKDTVVTIAPDADSVNLFIAVPVLTPGETFNLTIRLISTAGDTVFRAGPLVVSPTMSGTPVPVEVPFTYVGTGANAAGVRILSPDTTSFSGEPVLLTGEAFGAGGAAIPNTPIGWTSLDTARVRVTTDPQYRGVAVGGTQRGLARLVATLVTGQRDTVRVYNQPLPSAIAAETGTGQSGLADSLLPQPLGARVTGGDGLGIYGVWVRFTVSANGGSISADSVRTDSTGRAAVTYRMVRSFEPQVITATTARLAGQQAIFTPALLFLPPASLEIVTGDAQTAEAGAAVAVAPQVRVRDAQGFGIPGVAVTFTVTGGGGTVAGGTPVTDTLGIATAGGWTLGTSVGPNTLRASADTFQVTFSASGTAGPGVRIAFTAEPTTVTQDSVVMPPVVVTAFDTFGNVAAAFAGTVQLALLANPGGATLGGTTAVAAVAGVATFADLRVSAAGIGYTLLATSTGLTPDTSATFEVLAPVRQIRWINAAGGDWEVPANWNQGRVPTVDDSVVIDLAGTYTVGVTSTGAVAGNLRIGGAGSTPTLRIGAAPSTALTVADGLVNDGTILLTNDGLNASAALVVTTGTLLNRGLVETTAGAGAGGRTITGSVTNQGTIRATSYALAIANSGRTFISTTGTLATPNGTSITLSGGTVQFGSGTVLTGTGVVSLPSTTRLELPTDFTLPAGDYRLDLAGSNGITVDGPGTLTVGDTLVLTADTINAPLLLQGRVEARWTESILNGALAIEAGGLLRVGDQNPTVLTVATGFTNAGTILLTNDRINASASLTVTSGTLLNTGLIEATAGAGGAGGRALTATVTNEGTVSATSFNLTIVNTGRTFTGTSGTLATPNGTTLTLSGGTVQLGAETVLSGSGVFSLPAGTTLELPSDFTLAAGNYRLDLAGADGISVNGPGRLFAADTLVLTADTVNAPITVLGRLEARWTTSFLNGAVGVGPGALLRVGDASPSALAVAAGFTNDGTIVLTNDGLNASASLTVLTGTLVNDGLIEATAGAGGAGGRTLTADVLNAGTVSATSFNLTIANAGRTFATTGGTLATPNGNTLTISGGTVQFGSGTVLSGTGIVSLPAATRLELPTSFTLAAGAHRMDLAGSEGISVNGPGTFTVADTLVLTADTINAPLTIAGRVEARSTTSFVNGVLAIQPSGLLRVGDPSNSAITVAAGFTNAGNILLTNDGINASATLTVTTGTLVNTGTITSAPTVGGGPATMTLAAPLDHRGALTLNYPLAGLGLLTVPTGANASVTGNGATLSVAGVDMDGATFDNAPLVSTEGAIARFDNVTFQNMNGAAVQLTINHPGAAASFVFNGVRFLTPPSTGLYIRANDTNTGDGTPLTLEFVDATPPDGSAFEEELNGAVINWVVPPVLQVVFAGDSVYGVGPSTGVFTVNPDGTGRARPAATAPFTGGERFHPRWSPDRSRIAYGRRTAAAPGNRLYAISADGAESAAVVTDTNTALPRWSSDGVHLAFVCYGYDAQFTYLEDVCVINDVTGSVTALAGVGDGGGKVFISQLVGSADRLRGASAFAWDPANPDRLAFVRDSTEVGSGIRSSRIYTATYSAGSWTVQPLSGNVMDAGAGPIIVASAWLDWSTTGQLVFAAYDQSFQQDIYVINQDGSGFTQLTNSAAYDDDPLWSPDASEILFTRDESCSLDAWLMNADGTSPRQVTAEAVCDFDTTILGYDWSPDGQNIVLTGFDSPYSNVLIYRILRTTTDATYLSDRVLIGRGASAPGQVRDIQPSWRP